VVTESDDVLDQKTWVSSDAIHCRKKKIKIAAASRERPKRSAKRTMSHPRGFAKTGGNEVKKNLEGTSFPSGGVGRLGIHTAIHKPRTFGV